MFRACLMASLGHLPGAVSSPEQGMSRVIKDCLPFVPGPVAKPEILNPSSLNVKLNRLDDSWRFFDGMLEHEKLLKYDSSAIRPTLIRLQENQPHSIILGQGISENCSRNEEIVQALKTGSSGMLRSGLDLPLLSPEAVLEAPVWQPQVLSHYNYGVSYSDDDEPQQSLVIPSGVFHTEKPLIDFVGDLARYSEIVMGPDGQISFMGTRAEMKDLLSVMEEFYGSNKTNLRRKQSVVPYYYRRASKSAEANVNAASSTKVKSHEKVMSKPSSKKSSNKSLRERSPYEKSYSHASEILLSLIVNKGRQEKTMLLSLRKSSPELPELLTQISVGITGTGLAILFSVVSKMAFVGSPILTSQMLSTGVAFGLVWLSWGVNKLRDTIISIGKSSGKSSSEDEAMMSRVDQSMDAIFFRAATLMALIILRLS